MAKVAPAEQILDPSTLPETNSLPPVLPSAPSSRELPKHLADFKEYVSSKWCYFAKPVDQADLVDVQPKVAYQCHMKILVEERNIRWKKTAHPWGNETFLGSRTLGRLVESTVRDMGEGVGDMWDDYDFPLPEGDKKFRRNQNLPEGNYLTRCSNCRGKCIITCTDYQCNGTGKIETSQDITVCSKCRGAGKISCPDCKGLGGFLHSPTLYVKWHTRQSKWYSKNCNLPDRRIRKGTRTLYWHTRLVPWSKESSIDDATSSLIETTPDLDLKMDVATHYRVKHLSKMFTKKKRMRRFECRIERMDFEEVKYTMGETYKNKRDTALGNTFRFYQYPGPKGQLVIYENDYPLNCCGCFGEKLACYSCCCTIL